MNYCYILLFCLINFYGIAQTINVNCATTIKNFTTSPVAINLDYLMDDDSYLNPSIALEQSLDSMGVKGLRFPGGEKADNYLWSIPPYKTVNPHFATQGNCNWPNNDSRFSTNYIAPKSTTMDFDEFMVHSQQTNAAPFIVVAGDAHYNTFCPTTPSLASMVQTAAEWVRYANLTHSYGIKNWMVGNESWNKAAYDNPSTPNQYANDFIQFYDAMKAVDPTIKVFANSQSGRWVDTLLKYVGTKIDGIAISNYPIYNWASGYETYRVGNPNLVGEVNLVISSIGSRTIPVIVSEYNTIDFGTSGWTNSNDLGHALLSFQLFGDQIKINKVEAAYFWNTRWVNNSTLPNDLSDAITSNGNLNANGKALAIWGKYLLNSFVYATNDGFVNSFATLNQTGDKLNLFLINKDLTNHIVTVNIDYYKEIKNSLLTYDYFQFTGNAVNDILPQFSYPTNKGVLQDSTLTIDLNALSINAISFSVDINLSLVKKLISTPTALPIAPSFKVYPSPTSDFITIKNESGLIGFTQIKIMSLVGELLLEYRLSPYERKIISMECFSPGIYFVTNGIEVFRIEKE